MKDSGTNTEADSLELDEGAGANTGADSLELDEGIGTYVHTQ